MTTNFRDFVVSAADAELFSSMPSLKEQREDAIKRVCAAGKVVDVVDWRGEVVERWIPPGVPVDPRFKLIVKAQHPASSDS